MNLHQSVLGGRSICICYQPILGMIRRATTKERKGERKNRRKKERKRGREREEERDKEKNQFRSPLMK